MTNRNNARAIESLEAKNRRGPSGQMGMCPELEWMDGSRRHSAAPSGSSILWAIAACSISAIRQCGILPESRQP